MSMRSLNLLCLRPDVDQTGWPNCGYVERQGLAEIASGAGRDAHLHLHVEMIQRGPNEGAVERDRVMRIAHDRNGDKADLADAASRWLEIDPAGAWQIDLRPGMGRAASSAARRLLRILEREGEIPGSKPRGETEVKTSA
jgi:hypothetical protein